MLLTIIRSVLSGSSRTASVVRLGTDADTGNMFLGGILAVIFVDLAFILALYRKEFLPDVMIVKKRRRKWEDLYVREEDVDGVTVSSDDAWEQVKRAVYPYYKR